MIPHQRFTPLSHIDFDSLDHPHVLKCDTQIQHQLNQFCWCHPELHVGQDDAGASVAYYYHRAVH